MLRITPGSARSTQKIRQCFSTSASLPEESISWKPSVPSRPDNTGNTTNHTNNAVDDGEKVTWRGNSKPVYSKKPAFKTKFPPRYPKPGKFHGKEIDSQFPVRVKKRETGKNYDVEAPPASPLLDEHIFLPFHKKFPKAEKKKPSQMTPREWALSVNPYAWILASPPRQDVDHLSRLPNMLLQRFRVVRNPDTGAPHIVPSFGYKQKTGSKGMWALSSHAAITSLCPNMGRGGKRWLILVDHQHREKVQKTAVWKQDMPDYILQLMQKKTVDALVDENPNKVGVLSEKVDRIIGGPEYWETIGQVSAVLDFRSDEQVRKIEKMSEEEKEKYYSWENAKLEGVVYKNGVGHKPYRPPKMDKNRSMARVQGKLVPVHKVNLMFNGYQEARLREAWGIGERYDVVALMSTPRTTWPLMWLMRLRGYLGLEYAPERNANVDENEDDEEYDDEEEENAEVIHNLDEYGDEDEYGQDLDEATNNKFSEEKDEVDWK